MNLGAIGLMTSQTQADSDSDDCADGSFGSPSVYSILARHQRTEEWGRRELLSMLQEWCGRFVLQFELDIPKVALCVDPLPVSRLGHFRPGRNGFGLEGEIAINARYLHVLSQWEILGVLLHELLHAWQHCHGDPSDGNHHNTEYRRKARSLGLLIGRKGVTGYAASGRFRDLLRERGVSMPEGEIAPRERRVDGHSKSLKWSCGCTNVRCATALHATCNRCGQRFERSRRGAEGPREQVSPDSRPAHDAVSPCGTEETHS